jgi:hypothetical protein
MDENSDWITNNLNNTDQHKYEKYNGVKGFLSFFIAYLRTLKPIIFAYTVLSAPSVYYQMKDKLKVDPNMIADKIMNSLYIYILIELILTIYAFKIGFSLANKENNAAKKASRFIVVDYIVSVFCVFGMVIYASKVSGAPVVYTQPIAKAIAYSIWFLILFMYLKFSKRVKYTYQSN